MATPPARSAGPVRAAVWALHMALPLGGLWLLVARPRFDVRWEDHLSHFWLVAVVAAVNVALAAAINEASRTRRDARLFLVGLAFTASAGFFMLHAAATPGVLLEGRNAGFALASPAGVIAFAGFAAASAIRWRPASAERVLRMHLLLRALVVAALAAWGLVSLLDLPPLSVALDESGTNTATAIMAAGGIAVLAVAVVRYHALYRQRRSVVLMSLITAFVLLGEALAAMRFSRSWQASWWEWHVLMVLAFAFVGYSALVQYRREGSATGLFNSISLDETIDRIRRDHSEALEALVEAMRGVDEQEVSARMVPVAARLADRFGLTEQQTEVLSRAASALLAERQQIRRLDALVRIGRRSRVDVDELKLLEDAVGMAAEAFAPARVRVGLLRARRLRFPDRLSGGATGAPRSQAAVDALRALEPVAVDVDGWSVLALPLIVRGRRAGVLEVARSGIGFDARDRALIASLATQLAISLENTRLYRQIDVLFRQYMSPDVATALIADPEQAALGGAVLDVSVLFADLRGFTAFSEKATPESVVEMLNRSFGAAVPPILRNGGTVDKFVGDALIAIWGAPTRQADHALRAARAALEMQRAIRPLIDEHPGWPAFRIGVNSGPALVGNIGSAELRNYTAIGDTVNLASRLQAASEPGQVVIGEATYHAMAGRGRARPLGPITVKGRRRSVRAYVLTSIRAPDETDRAAGTDP